MEEENKCLYCFDENVQLLKYSNCNHSVYCKECYVNNILENFKQSLDDHIEHKFGIVNCLICKKENSFISGCSIKDINYLITDNEKQTDFYNFIEKLLKVTKVGNCNIKQLVNTILEIYIELFNKYGKPILLKANQSEILLQICIDNGIMNLQNNHKIRNLLVALSFEPWNVDKNIGGCGVCYHGNMGDIPGVYGGFKILYYNHLKMIDNGGWF